MTITVGFAGMTHLGINSAVATAAHGFPVVGFDADAGLVARLRDHRMPVVEPDLDDLVAAHADRLTFTAAAADLARCDVVYIAADVPTDDDAKSDLSPIRVLIEQVAAHLRADAVLVVLCQVPPGFTRSITSVPHDRLVYQVETLIFGRAVERAMHPERFIIGLADPAKGLPAKVEQVLAAFGCPILPMRYESAELAKISINFCLVASVSVANTLAEVSEAIGADWSEIAPALKLDKRIGPFAYLAPGLGISGGNLERDLRTVLDIAAVEKTDVGGGGGLDRQQPLAQGLAVADAGTGDRRPARRPDRGAGSGLQGEHPFHQEFAVAGVAGASGGPRRRRPRPGGAGRRGAVGCRRRHRVGGRPGRRRAASDDAMAGIPRHRRPGRRPGHAGARGHRSLWASRWAGDGRGRFPLADAGARAGTGGGMMD